ncbi:hypothetical protein C5Y96_08820 [Blastopirellula marina]|uniref:Glycosyltransferase RgtA/B/C/D-like domain-containing protein n=1 Tax=Blastopirellula marina TaxID=124 RepID=A0A2S8FU87_9BACT|nr:MULTISPECIES: hypothetical protein [Pirellulaceae]PQO35746.1 hypothetical protein C5Y96_08820 [Blastopirellula marina]RCS53320.1 hypothetical protein DTL36_08830 [Bremerella cremea]
MDSTSDASPTSPRRESVWFDWQWYAILVVALLIRGGIGYLQYENFSQDPDSYRRLADNIVRIHSFTLDDPAEPTAFRPPLYPLLLAITSISRHILPSEVLLLHVVLGVVTVGLTFFWAIQMGLEKWRSMAGLLVAIDPILLNQSTLVMTETLAACLAILALVAVSSLTAKNLSNDSQRGSRDATISAVNIAGAVGLAIFCRPTFLVWAALLPIAIWFCCRGWKLRLSSVLAYGLTLMFLLAPWVVRNLLVFEAPVLGTTHGGHTLLWGNNESYYEYLRSGSSPVWDNTEFHQRFARRNPNLGTSASELARDRAAYREAIDTMKQSPDMAAYSALVRFTMFWRLLPNALSEDETGKQTLVRYTIGVWYLVQLALVISGLIALGKDLSKPGWIAALMLLASFTLVHLFFWSNMRMRSPLVPILAVLACAGIELIWNRLAKR